jgi:cytochrome P450
LAGDAEACAVGLNASLDAKIAERKSQLSAGEVLPDDFLSRLVQMQAEGGYEDSVIRRIVGGTIVGTVDTNSKAAAQALDQLLIRPLTLGDARAAAQANDDDRLAAIVFEALRFNPQNPFLIRKCTVDTIIAAGTSRETLIKAGTLVLVGTQSAMFDPEVFPEPDAFRADRPRDKYIHFGHGPHTCFGKYFAAEIIPGCLKPLLKQNGLRRAGDTGLVYDGAFPDHYALRFDA